MKNRTKRQKRNVYLGFYILFAILLIAMIPALFSASKKGRLSAPVERAISLVHSSVSKKSIATKNADGLYSSNAILIDAKNGSILSDKNAKKRAYPASLTKIMTALIAIEHTQNLNEPITLSDAIFSDLYEQNASMAGFLPGEDVSTRDLLYGLLLPSGAECSIGLATQVAGSEEAFVRMMNKKAAELKMKNTHFTNSTGLHHWNHYTTAEDMSSLLRYALQNSAFREIFTSSRYSTSASNMHPDGITFHSTMFQHLQANALANGEIIGGKTGFTTQAGLCLASLARIDDREYILVTMGADGDHYTQQFHISDAIRVYGEL